MDLKTKISKALTALLIEYPFIGVIAMKLPFEEDVNGILPSPTIATDGRRIIYNREFVEGVSSSELKFVIAHEIFHPMLEHIIRLDGRNPKRWNVAGDIVINRILIEDGVGTMPDIGIDNPALYKQGEGVTDRIYNLLPEGTEGKWDDIIPGNMSPAEEAELKAEWKVMVAQAANTAKMMGKCQRTWPA